MQQLAQKVYNHIRDFEDSSWEGKKIKVNYQITSEEAKELHENSGKFLAEFFHINNKKSEQQTSLDLKQTKISFDHKYLEIKLFVCTGEEEIYIDHEMVGE